MMIYFFFNDTATTEIYTLSLHDALPILTEKEEAAGPLCLDLRAFTTGTERQLGRAPLARGGLISSQEPPPSWAPAAVVDRSSDRKSTRLNSSHANISYAVFCLKKKKI